MDLDDAQSVRDALASSGATVFDPGAMREELDSLRTSLEAEGVFNAPMYLVEGQTFQGREHLPMIRWLLSAEQEPVPI